MYVTEVSSSMEAKGSEFQQNVSINISQMKPTSLSVLPSTEVGKGWLDIVPCFKAVSMLDSFQSVLEI